MRKETLFVSLVAACVLAMIGFGCVDTSPSNSGYGYPAGPSVEVFPGDGQVVARNAAVWVGVYPDDYRVTDFTLSEVYGSGLVRIPTDAYIDRDANEFLFCPNGQLSANTQYYVAMRVGGEDYGWYFRTGNSYDGDPSDCYYVTPRGEAGVRGLARQGTDGWDVYQVD